MYKQIPIQSMPFDKVAAIFVAVFFSMFFILITVGRYFFTPSKEERSKDLFWILSPSFNVPVIFCITAMLYKISQL